MAKTRLALLIDGENVSASHMPAIMEHAKRIGEPLTLSVVGDFSANRLSDWADIAPTYALNTHFQRSSGKGRNSADIALTIRAMDLLAEGRFDLFLIVSSDCDFAPLALRLRSSGVSVYGMGGVTASNAWRAACTDFREFPKEEAPATANDAAIAMPPPEKKIPPPVKETSSPAKKMPSPANQVWSDKDRDAVRRILRSTASPESAWIKLAQLGQYVRTDSESLARRLRNGKLLRYLRSDPLFNLRGKGQNIEVSLKVTKRPAAPPTAPRPSPSAVHLPA